MRYLKLTRRNGFIVRFLKYGEWTIEQHLYPVPLNDAQVEELIKAITRSDLRKMIGNDGEHMCIQMEPHSAADLNIHNNEDIVELQELEVNWTTLEISVLQAWTIHVRLNPPLVKAVKNK